MYNILIFMYWYFYLYLNCYFLYFIFMYVIFCKIKLLENVKIDFKVIMF